MHRKIWFLVAAAVAVFALTGTAAATSGRQAMTSIQKAMAQTPQQRAAAGTINFGMEQDVKGFFALDVDETQFWAGVTGVVPEIRGNYVVDNKGIYHLDMASDVVATPTKLTIKIRPDATWFSPGNGTSPVTAADYAFTYNVITDPRNPVASTTGYSSICDGKGTNPNPYKIINAHEIVFNFCTPFADYKDLFGYILPNSYLPSADTLGQNNGALFNQVWRDCVCTQTVSGGNLVDGAPITDGPFYMESYTKGQGVVLKRTPAADWYGHTPQLSTVNFAIVAPGAPEVNALQGGELDAAYPAPTAALGPLQSDPNFVYDVKNGFVQEHWDFNQANPLLKHPWMRQAIALGMNRPSLIKAVYSDTKIAPGLTLLNSPEYELGKNASAPYDYFKKWNFNQTQALSILKQHCTGGPANANNSNTKIWTCPDGKASFDWYSTTLGARVQSGQIFQQQLQAIGIELKTHNVGSAVLFGQILPGAQTQNCKTHDPCGAATFDIAEYAWVGGVDPSGFDAIYQCYDTNGRGGQNYKNYCNPTVDNTQDKGDKTLNADQRTALYQKVSKIVSDNAYIVPLYARPVILVHKNSVGGMGNSNNPTSSGPTWNIEQWTS